MQYDLSIIIAHFKPRDLIGNPLIKTINEINNQKGECKIEIIIADDGSFYDYPFEKKYSSISCFKEKDVYLLNDKILKEFLLAQGLDIKGISKWAHYPKINNSMNKAFITNCAVNISKSKNLLLLDDDNYFISKNSIESLVKLFENYDLVFGQIKDNNNRYRSYDSHRVQGTTIGIKKNIFNEVGGLGEWTSEFSCAVDSDFWIKLYNYYNKYKINGCYTNQISTYDSFSKRWKKYTKFFKEIRLKKKFNKLYSCKNYKSYRSNYSRQKKLWLDNLIK
tara:strand:- start:4527 stop:5360 length:834 start_codon:yes stop_codon:yes gene_type:complete